jgi:hypothetical protein
MGVGTPFAPSFISTHGGTLTATVEELSPNAPKHPRRSGDSRRRPETQREQIGRLEVLVDQMKSAIKSGSPRSRSVDGNRQVMPKGQSVYGSAGSSRSRVHAARF